MSEIYQSTMALSVYNVLSLTKTDLPREKVNEILRSQGALGPNIAADYVDQGVEYLVGNGFAAERDGKLVIPRMPDGSGKPVVRCNSDRDLIRASY